MTEARDRPSPSPSSRSGKETTSGGRWTSLFVVSVAILLLFCALMLYLLSVSNDRVTTEIVWNRLALVFAAAEAITFTAVGWMFGREVNRKAAEGARESQKEAQAKTAEAADAKARGEALARAAVTSAEHAGRPAGQLEGVQAAALGTSNSQLDSLSALAQQLFPTGRGPAPS